jgi:hypothetical protein
LYRSFIINKSKITHREGKRVFIGSTEIPIGNNYRELFFREIMEIAQLLNFICADDVLS